MKTVIPHTDRLLTEGEAAEFLNVSNRTLEGWRTDGDGPIYVKLRRAVRYRLSDLQKFIASALRRSTSDRASGGAK